jgi:hypothetical protein
MTTRAIAAGRVALGSPRRFWVRRRSGLPPGARIFGVGLSRTGTSSLAQALSILGFWSLHHPHDDRTREEILSFLATGGDRLLLSVLKRLDAVTDTPVCATFEALDAAYPGSRFILTTRDKQSWLQSCRAFWATSLDPSVPDHSREHPDAYTNAICEKLYRGSKFDRARFSRAYDDYHERVRAHFHDRSGDLLTIDICAGEGWGPLSEFLDLPEPTTEFPRANPGPPIAGGATVGRDP